MSNAKTYTRKEFIDKYGSFIFKEIQGTGIFPETIISQAIIESQGKVGDEYRVGGSKLARESKNLFGIKASHGWKGKTYNIDTGEVLNGKKVIVNADFRAYNDVKDSIKDYIKFLKENKRYFDAGVFKSKDYYDQANKLKQAGYATSLNYADTIKSVADSLKVYISDSERKYKRNKTLKTVSLTALYISLIAGGIYFYKKSKY